MRKKFQLINSFISLIVFSQTLLSQTPVLKINDKTNPNVYLETLKIDVKIAGCIAVTTMEMVFRNKSASVLEGELVLPLPENISVSKYALDINGKMREAVPVEKIKGTQTFESIERRKVDPGLLEKVEGNNFRTRIYPIPANGWNHLKPKPSFFYETITVCLTGCPVLHATPGIQQKKLPAM